MIARRRPAPVIPNFGRAAACVDGRPRLLLGLGAASTGATRSSRRSSQHIELTLIAVGIGFVLAFALALLAHRVRALEQPIGDRRGADLHDPEPRALPDPLPFIGHHDDDDRDRARRLLARDPLPEHHRRASARRRPRCSRRRAAWGSTRAPGAAGASSCRSRVPAIIGGLRIAVVSTISIATIAAFLGGRGLGYPIFVALAASRRRSRPRSTRPARSSSRSRSPATSLLVLLRRVLVPWTRVGDGDRSSTRPTRTRSSRRSASSATTRASCSRRRSSSSSSPARRSAIALADRAAGRDRCSATSTAARTSRSARRSSAARCRASS